MYILDTDICVFLLRGTGAAAEGRLLQAEPGEVAVTSITAAELRYGAAHSGNPPRNLEEVENFLAPLEFLDFDDDASLHYAVIKHHLAAAGKLIGPMDLLIAATVRAHDGPLVTNNVREFSRVPGLTIENWKV